MSHLTGDNVKILNRVRRLRGQVEGVERMLQGGGGCYQILQSVAACRGALDSLTRELITEHIEHHLLRDESASESVKQASREVQEIIASYLK